MFWVALCWALKAVFFGGQDLGPSVVERILFGLKLLLFLFQAPRSGDELSLEAFLFEGFLWHDEILIAEANIFFRDR